MPAAGKAGISFDQHHTTLRVSADDEEWLTLLDGGLPSGFSEAAAGEIFAQPDIYVNLQLREGHAEATVWTCDLTHEYVTINADYRT